MGYLRDEYLTNAFFCHLWLISQFKYEHVFIYEYIQGTRISRKCVCDCVSS